MNILPFLKKWNQYIIEINSQVQELNDEVIINSLERYGDENIDFKNMIAELVETSKINADFFDSTIGKFETEQTQMISKKISPFFKDSLKLNTLRIKIKDTNFSYILNGSSIKLALSTDNLMILSQNIQEKNQPVFKKFREALIKHGKIDTAKNVSSYGSDQGSIQMGLQSRRERDWGSPQTKPSTVQNKKNEKSGEEEEEFDYKKQMRKDELRKKLEERKKTKITRSKIDQNFRGGR